MPVTTYTPDEILLRGQERYERETRRKVEAEPGNRGMMLALDVDSGEYQLAADSLAALDGLKARRPDAQVYIARVGYPTAVKIGVGRNAGPGPAGR